MSELLCCPFCGSQPGPLASEIDGSLVCDTCGARGPTHNVGLTVIFGGTMEEEYVNKTLAQTNVWHGNKGFFVSTINKKTSAMLSYGRIYSETLVWEWDSIAKKRGDLIGQDTHGEDCLFAHFNMVQRLFDTGKCEEPDDEEPTGVADGFQPDTQR